MQIARLTVSDLGPGIRPVVGELIDVPGLGLVTKVNWRFLPNPENLTPEELLDHLQIHLSENGVGANLRFELSRIEFALELGYSKIYIGTEDLSGYYAFTFPDDVVLFECPAYGNAAYIVRGDWEYLSQSHKSDLESMGIRVVHGASTWRNKIRRALRHI